MLDKIIKPSLGVSSTIGKSDDQLFFSIGKHQVIIRGVTPVGVLNRVDIKLA